jgi:hypothetical protein
MKKKPVIFLSNFHPFVTRNVFDSGVLSSLSKEAERVIVFTLKKKEAFLKSHYEVGNITIIGLDLTSAIQVRGEVIASRVAEMLLDTQTKVLHQKIYLSQNRNILKYAFARIVMATAAHSSLCKQFFRWFVLRFDNHNVFGKYFREYQPDITVSTDPFSPYDLIFMKNARRFPTKLIGFIRSWDNFTTKEYLHVKPDSVIVQNEDMVREGELYHDLEHFDVVGVPQFEYYKRYIPISREAFCTKMKLDPKRPIVLFSPAGDKFSSTDWQICEILKNAQVEGKLPENLQFIVRLHPMNRATLSNFEPNKNFVIDDPSSSFETGIVKEAEMGNEQVNHLADTLHHSSVVINSVSSLIIDAAIFDKPVVTISFDGWEKNVPFTRSVLTEQSNEWLQVLLDKGLSPKAHTADEMIDLVRMYLDDPKKDADKREEFVKAHCYQLDGRAPERIATSILKDYKEKV